MRNLKHLVGGAAGGPLVGVFEDGDRVQTPFLIRGKTTDQGEGTFEVMDPVKNAWIPWTDFIRSGP